MAVVIVNGLIDDIFFPMLTTVVVNFKILYRPNISYSYPKHKSPDDWLSIEILNGSLHSLQYFSSVFNYTESHRPALDSHYVCSCF